MTSPFKTARFKALAKEWNKKLVDSGHKEIEDFSLPNPPLLLNETSYFKRNINLDNYHETLKYFGKARDLLNTHSFQNALHRKVWELHSEGISVRNIARAINQKRFRKSTVSTILRQIKKEII